MTEKPQRAITIWFFVGGLFVVYGLLILAAGIFIESPPEVKMQHLHIRIWWGALLLAMGLLFTIRFWPGRKKSGQ
jgi:cytochrome c biogenesis protein CcdA